jgi:hypothetical protein
MWRLSWSRIVVLAWLAAFAVLASAHCGAKTVVDCIGLCENVLPCNDSYNQCIAFCTSQEDQCDRVGHPAVFLSYISCVTDAGFSCSEAGKPIANPPCGPAQAELVQCESNDDATLLIPDGAFDASGSCVDASSCLSCCADLWAMGAREYARAVSSCLCGPGGQCEEKCRNEAGMPSEVCAKHPMMPVSGDPCDVCVSAAINEQSADVGSCILPVTKECNANSDCALYVNCVSQSGCTN